MAISSALVLFAVIWFMALLIALPLRLKTQGDTGEVVPGTSKSAPVDPMIGKKMFWVTIVTTILWIPLVAVILSGNITIRDIDLFNVLGS